MDGHRVTFDPSVLEHTEVIGVETYANECTICPECDECCCDCSDDCSCCCG